MMKAIQNLLKDESGQGMTEYALIIGLVAVLLIVALVALKDQIAAIFSDIKTKLTGTGVTVPPTP